MSRPVTLFTGQWADLPAEELFPKVKAMGFDGVELACWGDHFDVRRALAEHRRHYLCERSHQGLGNPDATVGLTKGRMRRRQRLGGMLNYYHRHAA